MTKVQNKDTRYFLDLDVKTLKVVAKGYDQKQNLNKGRQSTAGVHRIFISKGQYGKVEKLIAECDIK